MGPVTLGTMSTIFVAVLAAAAPSRVSAASLEDVIVDRANEWSNGLGGTIRVVTGQMVDLAFDVRKLEAHVGIAAGGPGFGLRLHGDCALRDGFMRVRASIGVSLAGSAVTLTLPPLDMAAEDLFGHREMIVRVPFVAAKF